MRSMHPARSVHKLGKSMRRNYDLYLLTLPVVIFFMLFAYWPMYGVQIAFKDFRPALGIWDSPWAGLKHFYDFYRSFYFWRLIRNTLGISVYSLAIGIPAPIIMAIMFQEIRNKKGRSFIQSVSYAPNFMSVVVVGGIILMFLSPQSGMIPALFKLIGLEQQTSMIANPRMFWHIYVWSGVWQGIGWGSLIYTAAISSIPSDQYEVAVLEGASKVKQIWHITLPNLLPTIVIISILSIGGIMNVGFEKVFLLQNPMNQETSEVISTFVYKAGLTGRPRYSFAAMVGLFNNFINLIVLVGANFMARRVGETSLW